MADYTGVHKRVKRPSECVRRSTSSTCCRTSRGRRDRLTQHVTGIKALGGSRGTPGVTTTQHAMQIRERPTSRCPRASAPGVRPRRPPRASCQPYVRMDSSELRYTTALLPDQQVGSRSETVTTKSGNRRAISHAGSCGMAGSAAVVEGDGTTLMPKAYRRTRRRSNAGLETEGRSFSDWQSLREPLSIAVPGGYHPHYAPRANEPLSACAEPLSGGRPPGIFGSDVVFVRNGVSWESM